ncbi:Smr/MutS family protein [Rhodobacteraceae bacterium F11138]|nr:Smr/MutS family protein [Rhodobacteraceae bacterium F11138]
MSRRRLTPEEIDLWHRVVEKADRLHPGSHPAPPKPEPARQPSPPRAFGSPARQPSVSAPAASPALQMDRKAFGRLKRGKLAPEARIDLHGMTMERAHPALSRFILSSHAKGRRLVLVITGKGNREAQAWPAPAQRGILRRNVPMWLAMPPLAQSVLQVQQAHVSHGGEGAFYVYLRRTR